MEDKEIKDIKEKEHRVYVLHIRYIVLLCAMVCLFVTLVAPIYVTDEAFKNFSFASTISSIVLAVVSIVYSFYSSGGISTSIGEMKQVEQELENEIGKISDLKGHITNTVAEIRSSLLNAMESNRQASDEKSEEIKRTVQDLLAEHQQPVEKIKDEKKVEQGVAENFDFNINSVLGNLLIYALYRSYVDSRPFGISAISKKLTFGNEDYLKGYLVALQTCNNNFSYVSDTPFTVITVNSMNKDYFQFANIKNLIINSRDSDEQKKRLRKQMNLIDEFFNSDIQEPTAELDDTDSKV